MEAKGQIAGSTRVNYERFRDQHMKAFHPKSISTITEDDVRKLHQQLVKKRGGYAANSGLKFFNQVWRANSRRLGLGLSPAVIFTKNDADTASWAPESPKTGHIEPDQMFAWVRNATEELTTTSTKQGMKRGIAVSSHDLRRSFSTYAENSEVATSPAMAKALVNHSVAGDVYDMSHKDKGERMKAAITIQTFILRKAQRTAEVIELHPARDRGSRT